MKRITAVLIVAFVSSFAFADDYDLDCGDANGAGQSIFNHCHVNHAFSCNYCITGCLAACTRLATSGNCGWTFTEANACAVGCWEAYFYNACGSMPSAPLTPALEDLHHGLIAFGIDKDLIHTTFDSL